MMAYFDRYARRYEDVLQKSLNPTGENQEYFASRRVQITRDLLRGASISKVVDFGCGLGISTPHLMHYLKPVSVVGLDVSRETLKEAVARHASASVSFAHVDDFTGNADLVFCNGVFHHMAPTERRRALEIIGKIVESGGHFALWENNPLNPGTRYVMSRCEFDRDAVVIRPGEARRLLEANGFDIVRTSSAFFFPRSLSWLRGLEKPLAPTLLGGQYLLLAKTRKPR